MSKLAFTKEGERLQPASDAVVLEPLPYSKGVTTMNDKEVLNADELAALLGVDRKTVYDYAARGQIPHRRLGRRFLFSRTAVMAWLATCKVAATGKAA